MTDKEKVIREHMDKLHEYQCMVGFMASATNCMFDGGTYPDDIIYGMYELFCMISGGMEKSIAAIDDAICGKCTACAEAAAQT